MPKDGVFVAISPSRISDKSWGEKSAGSAHLQKKIVENWYISMFNFILFMENSYSLIL